MRAVIFLGGNRFRCDVPQAELYIAADSGWENAIYNDVQPDLICGDMDSVLHVPCGVKAVRVPAVKDYTDAQLAIRLAIDEGADEIILLGQLSGRFDHTLSLIFTVEKLIGDKIKAEIRDDRNRVRFLKNSSLTVEKGYTYFGVLSLGESAVTISGAKYPLDSFTLKRTEPFAISNEVNDTMSSVFARGDTCIVVESN